MKKTKINLWPLLPFAIILMALLAAQFMPNAAAEKPAPEATGVAESL